MDIDTATYCKYEKGERRPKREQVIVIAELLKADKDELLGLWLADQIIAMLANEKGLADKVLNVVQKNINKR